MYANSKELYIQALFIHKILICLLEKEKWAKHKILLEGSPYKILGPACGVQVLCTLSRGVQPPPNKTDPT